MYRILKENFEFSTIRGWGTISELKAFSQPLGGRGCTVGSCPHLAGVEAEYSELLCDFLHRGPASLPPKAPAGPQGLEKDLSEAFQGFRDFLPLQRYISVVLFTIHCLRGNECARKGRIECLIIKDVVPSPDPLQKPRPKWQTMSE